MSADGAHQARLACLVALASFARTATTRATAAGDFKGQRRSNDTHESKTDPDSKLYREGKTASELRYMGHTLTDNRHGLVVNAMVTQANGFAEREAAKVMIRDARQATASADTQVTLDGTV